MIFSKILDLLCAAVVMTACPFMAFAGQYKFSARSALAHGRWVKIGVADAGVYELSYSRLKEMGLSPEKVSVYGYGGMTTPYSLVIGGKNNVSDDLIQVPVYRSGDKIYFYARGLADPTIGEEGYAFGDRNVFTNQGHYFLTDSRTPVDMRKGANASELQASAVDCSSGYDYRINNDDRLQGRDDAGLMYWDYKMLPGETHVWSVDADFLETGRETRLDSKAMLFSWDELSTAEIYLSLNGERERVWYAQKGASEEAMPVMASMTRRIQDTKGPIKVEVTLGSSGNELYFDWWMVNYPKRIPASATGLVQERLGVTKDVSKAGYIGVNERWRVMDVTDPSDPELLEVKNGRAYFPATGRGHDLMVFDPSVPQLIPDGGEVVANQNIHAAPDCSLLIITVPEFLDHAREIAALHREYDGINTLVVTTEQIYDEFTSGNPSPMAYRMLVKMLYERKGEPLKNVLLMGPVRGDARNVRGRHDMPRHFLIGMQEGCANRERVAALTMGFYGNTLDNLEPTEQESAAMNVGVGLLPVSDSEDCRLAVAKIRRYLSDLSSDDMAWMVNETLGMSGAGDAHMHDNQAVNIRKEFHYGVAKAGAGKMRNSIVMADGYGQESVADVISGHFNQGKLFSSYIGHSRASSIGDIFSTGNFLKLKNKVPSFMMFAGCDLMLPDHGASGIVMESVLRAHGGLVGAVGSTRMAWANPNAVLTASMIRRMFTDQEGNVRKASPTFGEVYAAAMSGDDVSGRNKLVYEYIGDPALVIPVPLRGIDSKFTGSLKTFRGGDVILLKGSVASLAGDAPFNGTAVVKLCEPTQTRSQLTDPAYRFDVSDVLVSSVRVEVENGAFTARIPVPHDCDRFLSRKGSTSLMNIYLGAYDPSARLAASGYVAVEMAAADESRSEQPAGDESDVEPPVISAVFNADYDLLEINASDNVALLPGIGGDAAISLAIDGKPVFMDSDASGAAGVESCMSRVYVGDYADGRKHVALYSAVDMTGNASEVKSLEFTVSDNAADILLTMPAVYGVDSVEFDVESGGRKGLRLVVFDVDGKRVFQENDAAGRMVWDCSGSPAGVYRAAVMATDGSKSRSEWITFSVID